MMPVIEKEMAKIIGCGKSTIERLVNGQTHRFRKESIGSLAA